MKYILLAITLAFVGCTEKKKELDKFYFISYLVSNDTMHQTFVIGMKNIGDYEQTEDMIIQEWKCNNRNLVKEDVSIVGIYKFDSIIEYSSFFKSGEQSCTSKN